jgi:hypothetical protein
LAAIRGNSANAQEITRDLLLPRLISGKLSVEDLDIQFPPGMAERRVTSDANGFPIHYLGREDLNDGSNRTTKREVILHDWILLRHSIALPNPHRRVILRPR